MKRCVQIEEYLDCIKESKYFFFIKNGKYTVFREIFTISKLNVIK